MTSEILTIDAAVDYSGIAARAASVLDDGGVVVFPTETVYGVGARADLPAAVERLRGLKERSDGKPFTVHIPDRGHARAYVPSLSGPARRLVEKGWPGPLTLLFEVEDPSAVPILAGRSGSLEREVFHDGQVGLRCPDHPFATLFLGRVGGPVVAASANRAGHTPPQTAEEAIDELGSSVDLVVDGGRSQFAQASTIVRLKGRQYQIVREGVYDARTVRRLACMNLLFVCSGNTCRSPMAVGLCEALLSRRLGCAISDLPAHDILVRSAGTFAAGGARAANEAVEVMHQRGIDITRHSAAALSLDLIHQADRIYAMSRAHLEAIVAMSPAAVGKVMLLGGDKEIEDPVGKSMDVYEDCAATLEAALIRELEEVEP